MTNLNQEMRRIRRLSRLLLLLTALMVVVIFLYGWPSLRHMISGSGGSARAITPRGELMDFEKTTIQLFKNASPSVVFITTDTRLPVPAQRRVMEVQEGSGSGFIWDIEGHVVTNYHVIQSASAAHVILNDQSTYDAEIVGTDPDHDLAVLKISPSMAVTLVPLPLGTSGDLQVGQCVYAIGNPFGLDQTITSGIISALKRGIQGVGGVPIEDAIQIDAAINPGNSGGPLLDSAGRLIGVNTAILSDTRSGTWRGIGFAIPVDTANRVVPLIIKNGHYSRARISGIDFNDQLNKSLLAERNISGVAIIYVEPGSTAEKAGLRGVAVVPGGGEGGEGEQQGGVVAADLDFTRTPWGM